MTEVTTVRIDKWLWAVRLYPTRTAATEACAAGAVEVGDERVKPSRALRVGDVVRLRHHPRLRSCRVVRLIDKRVGAPIAVTCMDEVVVVEAEARDPDQPWWMDAAPVAGRERGAGRPTKRDRRQIDRLRQGSGD